MSTTKPFRAGFVALLGKPNAGKSTLLNTILGTRIAAVSALPQTTRERLAGIHSDEHRQIVFVDLPGMTAPTDKLNECLRENVLEEVRNVDAVLHLIDVADADPLTEHVLLALGKVKAPLVLAITKLDGKRARTDAACWAGENLPPELRTRYRAMVGVSSYEKKNLPALLDALGELLPESDHLFDPDDLTDRDLRYLTQEAIREKLFLHLHEELPYSTAVLVEEFEERSEGKWFIRAVIYVERESQKGMVIGRGGETLKKISSDARRVIEDLAQNPVYLELHVKVREKWRRNDSDLKMFGYKTAPTKKKQRKR